MQQPRKKTQKQKMQVFGQSEFIYSTVYYGRLLSIETLIINVTKTDTYIIVQKSVLHLFLLISTTRFNPRPTYEHTNTHTHTHTRSRWYYCYDIWWKSQIIKSRVDHKTSNIRQWWRKSFCNCRKAKLQSNYTILFIINFGTCVSLKVKTRFQGIKLN